MDVRGKRVLVCGMARSGIAAARLLFLRGVQIRAFLVGDY